MIKSILDTDLYKFSTSYAYFKLYPNADGVFEFTDRREESWEPELKDKLIEMFNEQINEVKQLSLTEEEMLWCIKNIPYIPATYWEWLSTFRFNPDNMHFWFDEDNVFHCKAIDKLYKVTLYEIMVLSIYSEIRNKLKEESLNEKPNIYTICNNLHDKLMLANKNHIVFSEFGTRRRYSADVQEFVIKQIACESKTCAGTSNVYFAMKYNMKPIGTFPHEWVMFHGATFGYKRANFLSLEDWINVYQGDLGTALVDTYTTDSFLNTLTKKQAHLLSGFRQDSGDEIEIGNKILHKIRSFGIDPKSKLIVFSNALDFDKAKRINDEFKGRCNVSFGIGTNLTNDTGVSWEPANIVMKLKGCRLDRNSDWENCIKISDDAGKHMGDSTEINMARMQLKLKV